MKQLRNIYLLAVIPSISSPLDFHSSNVLISSYLNLYTMLMFRAGKWLLI